MSDWRDGFDNVRMDRFIRSLKGISRLSNPKSRVLFSQTSMRDMTPEQIVGELIGSTATGTNGIVSLTSPLGYNYAMTNLVGFGAGSVLK